MGRRITVYQKPIQGVPCWRADIVDPRTGVRRRVAPFRGTGVPVSKQTQAGATRYAKKILAAWLEEAEEQNQDLSSDLTLDRFLEIANTDPGRPRGKELAHGTKVRRRQTLLKFVNWLRERRIQRIEDLEPIMVDQYRIEQRQAGNAEGVKRELKVVSRAITYCLRRLRLAWQNPVLPDESRRASLGDRREEIRAAAFSTAEQERILNACEDGIERDAIYIDNGEQTTVTVAVPAFLAVGVRVLCETGLRPGELFPEPKFQTPGLTWDRVDVPKGRLLVSGKSGTRPVIVSDGLRAVLARLHSGRTGLSVIEDDSGRPVTERKAQQAFASLLDDLRIPRRGFYGFRHRFALDMSNAGVPIHQLKKLMGHEKIATTELYLDHELFDHEDDIRDKLNRRLTQMSARMSAKMERRWNERPSEEGPASTESAS